MLHYNSNLSISILFKDKIENSNLNNLIYFYTFINYLFFNQFKLIMLSEILVGFRIKQNKKGFSRFCKRGEIIKFLIQKKNQQQFFSQNGHKRCFLACR